MNIADVQFPVFNPYKKATVEIYLSGCTIKCDGCQNIELQSFNYGKKLDVVHLLTELKEYEKYISYISILGGEPLDQSEHDFVHLCSQLSIALNKPMWLFTGKEKNQIPEYCYDLFDYIKYGKYEESLKQEGFPASSNQKLIKRGVDY